MILYRGMDRAALDAAYNNQAAVPQFPALSQARREHSERIRATLQFEADIRHGEGAAERLDFFPAQRTPAPLLVFIHGGYWQSSNKESHSWLVEGPLAHGFAVALVEYTLAPCAKMAQIVAEIERALIWLRNHADELGVDPTRIYVSGHSAGGHLAAMMMGAVPMAGAMPISGLFELEPIRLNYLNDKLGLDAESVERHSPMRQLPASCPKLVVTVGANELPELYRQSADFVAAMAAMGAKDPRIATSIAWLPLAGHDHFTILEELASAEGRLCRALVEMDAGVTNLPAAA